jgi:autophagy-related protein 9
MARDLSEHDIVARVMRKENYLVGMLNKVRAAAGA